MDYRQTSPECKVKVYNWTQVDASKVSVRTPVAVRGTRQTPDGLYLENIISCVYNKTKGSSGTIQFVLPYDKWDYSRLLLPGMWFALYMKNGPIDLSTATNRPQDGFRTVGVIQRVAKTQMLSAEGMKVTRWIVSAADWGHVYEQQLYINPYALGASGSLRDLMVNFNHLFAKDSYIAENATPDHNVLAIHTALFGEGLTHLAKRDTPSGPKLDTNAISPTKAMVVPDALAYLLLGHDRPNLNVLGAGRRLTDVVQLVLGIQKYNAAATSGRFTIAGKLPEKLVSDTTTRGVRPLAGTLTQATVWSLLSGFANIGINEMFADMKLNRRSDGEYGLTPTLVLRQIPFNSSKRATVLPYAGGGVEMPAAAASLDARYKTATGDPFFKQTWQPVESRNNLVEAAPYLVSRQGVPLEVTEYLSIPRTRLSRNQVLSTNLGKSLEELVNFVQVFPSGVSEQAAFATAMGTNFELNEASILRHGIRPFIWNTEYADWRGSGGASDLAAVWAQILADCYMNNHLWESGVIECIGVDEYIGVGDNIEIVEDGMLFHLESYVHTYSMSPEGVKTFRTSLNVSHGQRVDGSPNINGDPDDPLIASNATFYKVS